MDAVRLNLPEGDFWPGITPVYPLVAPNSNRSRSSVNNSRLIITDSLSRSEVVMIRLWLTNSEFSIAGRAGRSCSWILEVIESAPARGRHSHKTRLRFGWFIWYYLPTPPPFPLWENDMNAPSQKNDGMGSLYYSGDGTARFRVWAPFAA